MATPRNPLQGIAARAPGQVPSKDGEVLDLNIEELEERIAPLWNRKWI